MLQLSSTDSSASNVYCLAKIAPLGGAYTTISQRTNDLADLSVQMPISAAVDVGPGTYNVQAACFYGLLGPSAKFDRGDLTAVAIAR